MTERPIPTPIPHEVEAIRQWLEKDIVEQGICPPLIKLMHRYTDTSGIVNWDELSNGVDIVSYMQLDPNSHELVSAVSTDYINFITQATQGNAALTKIFILPDFKINPDYDEFVANMKVAAFDELLESPTGIQTIKSAFQQRAEQQGVSRAAIHDMLSSRNGVFQAGLQVIEGVFNPVFFYGQEVANRDLIGMAETRGSLERQKVLSRSPYYLVQVVNALDSKELIGNLDRERLFRRNTDLALQTNINEHTNRMGEYRK